MIRAFFSAQHLRAHPAIMISPPTGVTGPKILPSFSLASTNPTMLPEKPIVPARIRGAAYRARLLPVRRPTAAPDRSAGLPARRDTARSASPL